MIRVTIGTDWWCQAMRYINSASEDNCDIPLMREMKYIFIDIGTYRLNKSKA